MMPMIELKDISFSYDGRKKIIHDVSISFDSEIVALCGPNGSGKTTLLKIISQIIRNYTGKVMIYDRNIRELSSKELAATISFVSSDVSTPFDFKVIDILLMGRISHINFFSYYSEDDYSAVLKVAKETGIEDLINRNFLELSSGERELVLLSQSFVQNSPVIVMDEPFLHLDLKHKLLLLKIFRDYVYKKNGCGVIVLHDLRIAEKFCDSIVFIKEGKVVEKMKASLMRQKIELISEIYEVEKDKVKDFLL